MSTRACCLVAILAIGLLWPAASARADIAVPGASGQDGALTVNTDTVIDLGEATTVAEGVSWETTASNGNGVYDPAQWAVIYRYTSVDIAAGKTLRFTNNEAKAPVIWLVNGNVTISGTININGANGHSYTQLRTLSEPGPGGFSGGRGSDRSNPPSAGQGPGAGKARSTASNYGFAGAASHATLGGEETAGAAGAVYGSPGGFPLIGGSGGGGGYSYNGVEPYGTQSSGGGAGGGAILIVATGTVQIDGAITADGGAGGGQYGGAGGSGGTIRIVADTVSGNGNLSASARAVSAAYTGGSGYIRIEANNNTLASTGTPAASVGIPDSPPKIWRDATTPLLWAKSLNGIDVPLDPKAALSLPADVQVPQPGQVPLILEAQNVPEGSVVKVWVTPRVGQPTEYTATYQGGNGTVSTWQADIALPGSFSTIQARATLP